MEEKKQDRRSISLYTRISFQKAGILPARTSGHDLYSLTDAERNEAFFFPPYAHYELRTDDAAGMEDRSPHNDWLEFLHSRPSQNGLNSLNSPWPLRLSSLLRLGIETDRNR